MRRSIRAATAGIAAAAALVLSLGLATSASAATTGPSGPEYFTVSLSLSNPNGTVNAYGPVAGRDGTLQTPAATAAVFQFRHGNVNVWHSAEPSPTINWRTCTATVSQYGAWAFTGGTGQYRGARGSGHFLLKEFSVFKVMNGKCQAANPNAQPVYLQLNVQGFGYASLPRHH
ncbi:MAG: hypothetical protein ACLP8X_19405 [Streptosporangiaceae bacterium]